MLAPGVDETLCVGDEQPRPDGDADQGRDHPAGGETDALRRQVHQGVRHGHHIGRDVGAQSRQYQTCRRMSPGIPMLANLLQIDHSKVGAGRVKARGGRTYEGQKDGKKAL